MAFSKEGKFKNHMTFKVHDEEKRIVSGFAMMADKPIDRLDDQGNIFQVKFTADSVKNIALSFFKNNLANQTNANHETDNFLEGVFVFESMIIDKARGINVPKGFDKAPDGSWFISMKVDNDQVWQQVLDGTFKGFSVEGMFDKKNNDFMQDLKNLIESTRK